jgi:CDP-glucose 4,6-dehydratase
VKTVGELVSSLVPMFPDVEIDDFTDPDAPHEAKLLTLDSSKAKRMLGWTGKWNFKRTVRETAEWYKRRNGRDSAVDLCRAQIESYMHHK